MAVKRSREFLVFTLFFLLPALAGNAGRAKAQSTRIRLDTLALLNFSGLPRPAANAPKTVAPSGDRFAVAPSRDGGEILVIGREGELRARLGSVGGGPGEFRRITALTYDGYDSLYVFDSENNRGTVFGPDHEFARDFPLDAQVYQVAWASEAALVLQGFFRDLTPPNSRARILTPQGLLPTAFDDGIVVYGGPEHTFRAVTTSNSGGFWMAEYRRMFLTLFDEGGRKADSLAFHGEWMRVEPRDAEGWEDLIDVRPAVLGISEDPSGMMWILCGVPPEQYPEFKEYSEERSPFDSVKVEDLGHQLLSVFHPDRREAARATLRLDSFIQELSPGGFGFFGSRDETGDVTIAVARLHLIPKGAY